MVNMVDLNEILYIANIFLPIFCNLFLFTLYLFLILSKNQKKGCTRSFSWYFIIFLIMQILSDFFLKLGLMVSISGISYYIEIAIILHLSYIISFPVSMFGYIILFLGMETKLFSKKTKWIYTIISTLFYLFMLTVFVASFFILNYWHYWSFYSSIQDPWLVYSIINLIANFILVINPILIGLFSIVLLLIFWYRNSSFGIFSIYLIFGIIVLFIISPGIQFIYQFIEFLSFNGFVTIHSNISDLIIYLPYISNLIKLFGVFLLSWGAFLKSVVPINSIKKKKKKII